MRMEELVTGLAMVMVLCFWMTNNTIKSSAEKVCKAIKSLEDRLDDPKEPS